MLLEKEIKAKERRIMEKENEIYSAELNSIGKIDAIIELQRNSKAATPTQN